MAEQKVLNAEDILGALKLGAKRTLEPVDVPEWGGRVFVRDMTAAERDRYDMDRLGDDGKAVTENFRARLVVATCCDESGKLLFTAGHVKTLGEGLSAPVIRIYRAAAKLNRLNDDAIADEKKDSAEAPSGGSVSGSP